MLKEYHLSVDMVYKRFLSAMVNNKGKGLEIIISLYNIWRTLHHPPELDDG